LKWKKVFGKPGLSPTVKRPLLGSKAELHSVKTGLLVFSAFEI
jgi:hypothetical protein